MIIKKLQAHIRCRLVQQADECREGSDAQYIFPVISIDHWIFARLSVQNLKDADAVIVRTELLERTRCLSLFMSARVRWRKLATCLHGTWWE